MDFNKSSEHFEYLKIHTINYKFCIKITFVLISLFKFFKSSLVMNLVKSLFISSSFRVFLFMISFNKLNLSFVPEISFSSVISKFVT